MEDVVNYLKNNFGLLEFVNKQENTKNGIKNFVFVIDEINRGEISKIFGELFFSIDPSYRGKKGAVKTQYSNLHDNEKEVFYVPKNVYIIGSMNDIDRSVESFDFAMRRRFNWIEISAEQSAENMNLPDETKSKMAKLNEQISLIEGLNHSYHIGAAYFLDSNGNARQDYNMIWDLRIEPLLKEYLRGIPDGEERIEILKNAYSA
jgi:5-methylcytosine-specific restriction endonuclease McrBC GTP-binding regulatory subunit McrB